MVISIPSGSMTVVANNLDDPDVSLSVILRSLVQTLEDGSVIKNVHRTVFLDWDPSRPSEWSWRFPAGSVSEIMSGKKSRTAPLRVAVAEIGLQKHDAAQVVEELSDPASLLSALSVMES